MPRKLNDVLFFGFHHSFRGLTHLKLKNFNQKLKISNNIQNFAQCSSEECLINTYLHHTMKIKGSNFYLDLVTLNFNTYLHHTITPLNSRISTKKFKISNNTQ